MNNILAHPRVRNFFTSDYPDDFAERHPDYASFTPWMPLQGAWDCRVRDGSATQPSHPVADFLGVYLIALFDGLPSPGAADPFDSHVVYIGRTRTAPLLSRWTNFRASAMRGNGPHSGGNEFYRTHVKDAPEPEALLARTWIAGLPVWFKAPEPAISFRTALIESVLVDVVHHAHRARGVPNQLLNKP